MRLPRLLLTGSCLTLLVACGDTGDPFVTSSTTTQGTAGAGGTTSAGGAGGAGGTGGVATGGSGGAGGTGGVATGGSGGAGGTGGVATGGSGGTGGTAGCLDGEKLCGDACVQIGDPAFGCKPSGCEPCDIANAAAICQAGACAVGTCSNGYDDCDQDPLNGCEVNLDESVSSCGGCGHACVTPHGTSACVQGACEIAACDADFVDCDKDPATGCEADLLNDPARCGACDTQCLAGEQCQAGQCGVYCDADKANCDGDAENGCETDLGTMTDCGFCGDACDLAHATAECSASLKQCAIVECEAGYTDCDGLPENGCEAHTDGSALDCGVCGNACPSGPNSTAVCTGGACSLSCKGSFADCDKDPSNGCERDTNTVTDCGACDVQCSFNNAAASCSAGLCQMGACTGDFRDCNGSTSDGCEVNKSTDVNNCGACNTQCSFNNAAASCSAGLCQLDACSGSFLDCDGNPGNGCEVNGATDNNHCGACNNKCTLANALATCGGGACKMLACVKGYNDCDKDSATGCEINTAADVNNCGGCDQACSTNHISAACSAGSCSGVCAANWGDCNGNKRTDGCETSLADTAAHCGGCGQACSANHVTGTLCSAGNCTGACEGGWADCDANKRTNGCETSLNTDPNNCGGCDRMCSSAGVSVRSCTSGVCDGTCATGYLDCNGNKLIDGCEINKNTDANNCGGCDQACSTNHITAACSAGSCSGTCAANWGDCNNNKRTDGCETSLADTAAHCGGCGQACSTNHITAACSSNNCTGTCTGGWLDCNNNKRDDGCEINPATNANHCGSCGNKCAAGEVCAASTCRPANDLRANATAVTLNKGETTIAGTTLNATHDGYSPGGPCASWPDVWYKVTFTEKTVFYADTVGSPINNWNPLGLFRGDGTLVTSGFRSSCPGGVSGGFDSPDQTRISAVVDAGTYYISVGSCSDVGVPPFKLNIQHLSANHVNFNNAPLPNETTGHVLGNVSGTGKVVSTKCTTNDSIGYETVYWYQSCGGSAPEQVFSLRPVPYGAFTFHSFGSIYTYSGQTGGETMCDRDGAYYIAEVVEHGTRGIHEVFVDPSGTIADAFRMYHKIDNW
jgi:hypothetical protein